MSRLLGLFGVALVWEFGARLLDSIFFPPITTVLPAAWRLVASGDIVPHVTASLLRISLGFLLAASVGILLGILIYEFRPLRLALMPVVDAVRPIAALTIFPLLILLLGLGDSSKIAVIFWTSWPAVLLNTAEGLRRVDNNVHEAAQLDGASRLQLLRFITLPLALPVIVTGLRIGMSGGWISVVSAEMLGASRGLGYSILAYSQTFRFPEMYAIIIFIALCGLGMNVGLAAVQNVVDRALSGESPFWRYHDRAIGWNMESLLSRPFTQKGESFP